MLLASSFPCPVLHQVFRFRTRACFLCSLTRSLRRMRPSASPRVAVAGIRVQPLPRAAVASDIVRRVAAPIVPPVAVLPSLWPSVVCIMAAWQYGGLAAMASVCCSCALFRSLFRPVLCSARALVAVVARVRRSRGWSSLLCALHSVVSPRPATTRPLDIHSCDTSRDATVRPLCRPCGVRAGAP